MIWKAMHPRSIFSKPDLHSARNGGLRYGEAVALTGVEYADREYLWKEIAEPTIGWVAFQSVRTGEVFFEEA